MYLYERQSAQRWAGMSSLVQKVGLHPPGQLHWCSQQAFQMVRETGWASRCGGASDLLLMVHEWWKSGGEKSSEHSCFSNATVSYSICNENGLLMDTQTCRLMHMHALEPSLGRMCTQTPSAPPPECRATRQHFCCHKRFELHNR